MSLQAPIDPQVLRDSLRQVIDPEVGMNIVDLGLVYGVTTSEDDAVVTVEMTMTSPSCPMSEMIIDEVEAVLRQSIPTDTRVDISLVWTPPWGPERMSPEARKHFGW